MNFFLKNFSSINCSLSKSYWFYALLVGTLTMMVVTPLAAQSDFMDLEKNALKAVDTVKNGTASTSLGAGLTDTQIGSGLKDALRVGTKKAVATVGRSGGFLNDKQVHIPLPGPLAKVKSGLSMIGASGMAEDLEQRINKAAETAAPKAANIFADAVGKMSIDDARSILTGPKDAATQYFKRTTTPQLTEAMKPIVDQSMSKVGAVQSYNALTAKVQSLPLPSNINLDLSSYVVGKTLDGIFYYVAQQEAEIRANPAARTTEALRAVFK